MANPEHLALLKQGVEAWNEWRQANPGIKPDLYNAILRGAILKGANFERTNLMSANFEGANFEGANLIGALLCWGANFEGANFEGANLYEALLSGANLKGVNFEGAILSRAKLGRANLKGVNFGGAILYEVDLGGANLEGTNLRGANFEGANLGRAKLRGAILRGANLKGADLREADLRGADLGQANLRRADLGQADLRGVDLSQADLRSAILERANLREALLGQANLRRADLGQANLRGADLSRADLHEALLDRAFLAYANLSGVLLHGTILSNTILIEVKGLDTCRHNGPSYLDFHTLQQSGPLPLTFLRGCGLPDLLIDYLPSLLDQPIQFYSCFISYSSKDEDFAQRLYADLQNKGVRCWFAPEDIQGGRKLHEQIGEAIRLHEKLLLVLSERSMNSEWVKTEIAEARQREVCEKRQVLFPISLVAYETIKQWKCFDADTGKDSAREIREYFIPDFSNWKSHDAYQQAFDRLLRDLKPELERKPETP